MAEPRPSPDSFTPSRRPLRSRQWTLTRRLAAALAAGGVTPNAVSLTGMFTGVGAGLALWGTAHVGDGAWPRTLFLAAAVAIQFRLLCNLIDGMIAVEGKKATPTGELYNEVPDRVSDACTLIGAGYALGGEPTLGWLAALLAVLTAYIRAVGHALYSGNDYCGPMAKQHRMALLTVACVLAATIPGSWHARLADALENLGAPSGAGLMVCALAIIAVGSVFTCVRRLLRIARRLHANNRPSP